jgi:hypothetical protein
LIKWIFRDYNSESGEFGDRRGGGDHSYRERERDECQAEAFQFQAALVVVASFVYVVAPSSIF